MTDGQATRSWRMEAPAKLNLGLEILGRRPDGFHDIRSIMQTVSLTDTVTVRRSAEDGVRLGHVAFEPSDLRVDDGVLNGDGNLAVRGVQSLVDDIRLDVGLRVDLRKRIPAASGLGGASTDVAAALTLTRLLLAPDLPEAVILRHAATLGSDVPFVLNGGTALVEGRGDVVTPLPMLPETWFVIIYPLRLPAVANKTKTLYAALRPDDVRPTGQLTPQVDRIREGQPLDATLLGNAFAEAMVGIWPQLADLRQVIERETGLAAVPSGAGPAHYVAFADRKRAGRATGRLNRALMGRALVWLVEPVFGK